MFLYFCSKHRRVGHIAARWFRVFAFVSGLLGCTLPVVHPCGAQTDAVKRPWQTIQMATEAEVKSRWKSPPPEYGPEPYYGLNGIVTLEVLQRDMDTAKRLGFHAVTVQPGRGNKEEYLSPAYFALFKQLVEEARKRDLRVWIIDDAGYPSGFAGGLISKEKPELQMQALTIAHTQPVKNGETLKESVGPDTVAAIASDETGRRFPVTISGGTISWTAPPAGEWNVLMVDHVFRTSPTASATNLTRQKDTTQALEDYMNPAATAAWINLTHEGYYKAMPEEFGKTIVGFRGDEPDYSIAGLPWTPAFFDRFAQLKGYDVRLYLGGLLLAQAGRGSLTPGLTDVEQRARADYYDVFSVMFRDGFFKPQADWCSAHGVEYQVHLNHEEMEMQLVRSEGEFIRDMKYVQVPGIDAIWHQVWTDTIADYPRLAASAAHLYGHPRSFTESFGAYRPAPDLTMAKYVFDEQIVRGINLTEGMSYGASSAQTPLAVAPATGAAAAGGSQPQRRGGLPAAMADPGWPALMDYISRLSYVMSMGRPAASVALYLPSSSLWYGDAGSDAAFVSSERMLSERQIDFDIINLDALATDLKAGVGTLETLSGNRYRTIIFPSVAILSQAELDRLREFARGGGKVLFLGRTPALIYGRAILDARAASATDFSWAAVETSAQIPPTPTPPGQPPAAPPAPMDVPAAIEAAVAGVVGTRDVLLNTPDPAVKILTRRLQDASVYLFFNEGAVATSHSILFKAGGKTVEVWDPQTGLVSPLASTRAKGSMIVELGLNPYETRLLLMH
jgi:hypothetical protein